jgi:four helix bundle protein
MFIAYDVTKQLITKLRGIVAVIQPVDDDLADQLRRAATSVLLNLSEGQKSSNGNKLRHYKIAQDSAQEIVGALDAAEGWGIIDAAPEERALLDRLLALMWKLTTSPKLQPKAKRTGARQALAR